MATAEQGTIGRRERWRQTAADEPGTLLFESSGSEAGGRDLLFRNPLRVLTAYDAASLTSLLTQMQQELASGFYVAGLLTYEAGYAFERVRNQPAPGDRLAWFGVYREPEAATLSGASEEPAAPFEPLELCVACELPVNLYVDKVREAQRYIAAGDTYQVNLTTAVGSSFRGDPLALYRALAQKQPAPFSAYLHLPDGETILSFSPELFFDLGRGGAITVRPMKGTAPVDGPGDGKAQERWLAEDEKNRAEHLMIVDLLRSDLGRICKPGGVRATSLFAVERYQTLLQMTSTIAGQIQPGLGVQDALRALFPSGSMTGAPKPRTMEIIAELEAAPRGVYSGALGFVAPGGAATFNVAIRTVTLKDERIRMGVGGGIVADSDPLQEYAECWLKAKFLLQAAVPFSLFETLLWDGGYAWQELHLDRLALSAEALHFSFDRERTAAALLEAAREIQGRKRVRLQLERDGELSCQVNETEDWSAEVHARVSAKARWSKDSFLTHKTTYRHVYDDEYRAAREAGFDEALFTNERGELTEGAVSSILVRIGGEWRTPELRCGVLPGVARRLLFEGAAVTEAVMTIDDLRGAAGLCVCNGVRGLGVVRSLRLQDGSELQFPAAQEIGPLLNALR